MKLALGLLFGFMPGNLDPSYGGLIIDAEVIGNSIPRRANVKTMDNFDENITDKNSV